MLPLTGCRSVQYGLTPYCTLRHGATSPPVVLQSVVTFTLTPTSTGTHLRMEQSGFRPDQKQAYGGANAGWQQFFAKLEQILARPD